MCPVIPYRGTRHRSNPVPLRPLLRPTEAGRFVSCRFSVFVGTGIITLQGTNISHLGRRKMNKIIFKMPFLGGYVIVPWRVKYTILEGIVTIHIYGKRWGISPFIGRIVWVGHRMTPVEWVGMVWLVKLCQVTSWISWTEMISIQDPLLMSSLSMIAS